MSQPTTLPTETQLKRIYIGAGKGIRTPEGLRTVGLYATGLLLRPCQPLDLKFNTVVCRRSCPFDLARESPHWVRS